ncbi:MAG: transcriptional repressor [Opitutales bacterium]|nr:transcriptional repressor [Opitutales bacterium]
MKRKTRQGKIVSGVIRSAKRPLTPLEIHEIASLKIPRLGIATTYRHLRNLIDCQQVVGVDYPGQPPRYEWADGEDKVHFTCRSCNKLFALEDTTEDSIRPKVPKGFDVQGFEVMLYGNCPDCRVNIENQKE